MADDVNFGTDISREWVANSQGDFKLISDKNNALQAIYNRLTTKYDELGAFQYLNYGGNQSYEVIGSTDLENAQQEIELYTRNCLLEEPRVEAINQIKISMIKNGFTGEVNIQLIGEDSPDNIVFTKTTA